MSRVLGVDLGDVRIGLAVSDEAGTVAVPHATLERSGDRAADHAAILGTARDHGATTVVVGLPLTLEGEIGTAARRVLSEVDDLRRAAASDVTVEVHDERLTTVTADRRLAEAGVGGRRRRDQIDRAAAAVILQAYLDARRGSTDA